MRHFLLQRHKFILKSLNTVASVTRDTSIPAPLARLNEGIANSP
jgi:hypothetical protein